MNRARYIVRIAFVGTQAIWDMQESFTSMKAVRQFEKYLDNTVDLAVLTDTIKETHKILVNNALVNRDYESRLRTLPT